MSDDESAYYVTRYGRVTTTKTQLEKIDKMAVQLTNEQFEKLIAKVSHKPASFATCKYTYDGHKGVEAFLAAINVFKRAEAIAETTALEELPLLLKEDAGTWWQGVKVDVKTWKEFEQRLRYNFEPKKEAHVLYAEIFQTKQDSSTTTDEFIRNKRMLFAQLPKPIHPEEQQLDMLYSLLRFEIRDKISRLSIKSFDDLIAAARGTERVLKEKGIDKPTEGCGQNSKKPKCRYCKNIGHTIEVCRKKEFNDIKRKDNKLTIGLTNPTVNTTSSTTLSGPKFSCYGCGAPGVVRSNCPTCHKVKIQHPPIKEIGFCAVDTTTDARDRPIIFVDIDGVKGSAYVDTCAKSSIASYSLYCDLKK